MAAGDEARLVQLVHPERRELASRLGIWTAELLAAAGLEPRDIDLVAVGRGPGSWTGLRIGLSFARAFAWARGVRCAGVPSADATARALATPAIARLLYVANARAGELAIAEFARHEGSLRKVGVEHNVPMVELADALAAAAVTTLVCGEGASMLSEAVGHPHAHVTFNSQVATAEFIARQTWRLLADDPAALADVSPIYAAASSAELNFESQQRN